MTEGHDDHQGFLAKRHGGPAHEYLVARAATKLVALAIGDVVEVLRPLPVSRLDGAPPFVLGAAVVRGAPVPVVDARLLLEGDGGPAEARRWISLRVGGRRAALAVDEVVGARRLDASTLDAVPPLLRATTSGAAETVAALDEQLLLVLRAGRLVPDAVWQAIASGEGR